MSVRNFFLVTAIWLLAGTAFSAERPVHVFILSGQSNMVGMKAETGFVPEAEKLFPNADIVFFKVAVGGQPIRRWVARWDSIANEHGLTAKQHLNSGKTQYYEPILTEYAKLLAKHPQHASVTFCWMQGERDAREGLSAAYEKALQQLVNDLRRDLKQPQLNVVIGRLSDYGRADNEHWQAVRKAHVEFAQKYERGAWVDCDDLNDLEKNGKTHNDLHYTKAGYELLGRRFARQAKALIEGQEPADDGRPQ